ncbi:hypothetical protein [Pseudomonas gessardii]|uniref:Lipopolysaccharide biosynthesis protein n=1 Tax=Pseudomonas gessardii TaxID=78544 RepID=A0A7Y1MT94_9PSED|nr:hypothetical protein [Pseudomonas gessardii]NNA97964.1 hypothetical protein [Pseudomonas gessardii]
MKQSLQGKKVLYIAPRFFGYESEIRDELTKRGAHVDFLLDRPFDTPLLKAITRVSRELVIGAADRFYENQLESLKGQDYDYVFVINGQTLSSVTLARWHQYYPRAKFVLYMWDSFGNRRWAVDNLNYFDVKFTFDREDAKAYGLNFRPLFFSSGFEASSQVAIEWDISFIGTAHTDRYAIASKVAAALGKKSKIYWYLFLQAPWVYWLYKISNRSFREAKLTDFKFSSLTKSDVQSIFNASGCILDIEHPKQTGLTMRTLETLGARKKLVTTNQSVRHYDFFDECNICVVDRWAPKIPSDFLTTPYRDIDVNIYHSYRLEGWVDEIFQVAQR